MIGSKRIQILPCWYCRRGELRIGDQLVKIVQKRATNERIVLDAFQKAHWISEVKNAFPGNLVQKKQRLRDTVRELNCSQKIPLLRFSAGSKGMSVKWTYAIDPFGIP